MADILDETRKEFGELGISRPADVATLFKLLHAKLLAEIADITSQTELEAARVRWLGRRSGILTQVKNNWLNLAPSEWKRQIGSSFNILKNSVEEELRTAAIRVAPLEQQALRAIERLDLTLPGNLPKRGARHLITQTLEEMEDIFARIGFSVVEGPEIETSYYNFEALNLPEFHPARDTMATLYVSSHPATSRGADLLLRTHTSPVQVRVMEQQPPPVRIIVPGKVYRRDNPDATHSFMFHQVEGLAVAEDITFCDFKGTIEYFLREFFGPQMRTRFRPSYFPFTEPSAEVDGSCIFCSGAGCRICKYTGWIELFGAGMVDPAVYEFVGYDATKLNGFAFGIGVDRFAMLKYGVDDMQLFFQNDVRFLQQFRR